MSIIFVENLVKRYRGFHALDGCNLTIPEGSVYGLLGPNGAGKTTLIRSLLGFIRPTSGRAMVDGFDCVTESLKVRECVSYLPAETKLFRTMKGSDCMEFFTSIHPRGDLKRAKEIAQRLQLDCSRRVAFMSTGMRQKLAISCVLSCSSRVIILDEPTANLDPNVRQEILQLVTDANARGTTVVFCSHVLSEIEEICDRAAFLRRGKIVYSVALNDLPTIHRLRGNGNIESTLSPPGLKILRSADNVIELEIEGNLSPYMDWLSKENFQNLTIESVGLKQIYDRIHRNGDAPCESAPDPNAYALTNSGS